MEKSKRWATMREIKFRARGAYQRSVWYVGDLVRCDDGRITIRENEANEFYVDPATVGQFTGIYDCTKSEEYPTGRPIYEGDILHVICKNPHWGFHSNYVVEWCEDGWILDGDPLSRWFKLYDLKVIGNVHDNPELVEVKQ